MKKTKLFWLERLINNIESAKGIRWPKNDQDELAQAFALMAYSINIFHKEVSKKFSGASKSRIQLEKTKIFAQFSQLDYLWSPSKSHEEQSN